MRACHTHRRIGENAVEDELRNPSDIQQTQLPFHIINMKIPKIQILALGGLMAFMVGCASTPNAADAKKFTVFRQPVAKVQTAAVNALTVIGCDINKNEPTYVEGFRPHKIGVFVGSGGETVGVWLAAQAQNSTQVRVKTSKSLIGMVGQKDWDEVVLADMKKSLGN